MNYLWIQFQLMTLSQALGLASLAYPEDMLHQWKLLHFVIPIQTEVDKSKYLKTSNFCVAFWSSIKKKKTKKKWRLFSPYTVL